MKTINSIIIGLLCMYIIGGTGGVSAYACDNQTNGNNKAVICQDNIETSEEHLFSTDYVVNVTRASYWSEPSINSTWLGYVYRNDVVHVISIKDNWAKFKTNGTNKYIYAAYLTKK